MSQGHAVTVCCLFFFFNSTSLWKSLLIFLHFEQKQNKNVKNINTSKLKWTQFGVTSRWINENWICKGPAFTNQKILFLLNYTKSVIYSKKALIAQIIPGLVSEGLSVVCILSPPCWNLGQTSTFLNCFDFVLQSLMISSDPAGKSSWQKVAPWVLPTSKSDVSASLALCN